MLDGSRSDAHRPAVTLRLDVLRHGAAEAVHADGDRARRLTPEGAARIRELGQRLARSGWRPARVLTSPYVRAVETATLVLEAVAAPPRVEPCQDLTPDRDPERVAAALAARLAGDVHALIVGHQPLLGRLVTAWTGRPLELKPGEFVPLEFADGPALRHARRLPGPV